MMKTAVIDPIVIEAYDPEALKRELAESHRDDPPAYTEGKDAVDVAALSSPDDVPGTGYEQPVLVPQSRQV